jgi:hypothetical protein
MTSVLFKIKISIKLMKICFHTFKGSVCEEWKGVLLSVAAIRRNFLKTTHTEECSSHKN